MRHARAPQIKRCLWVEGRSASAWSGISFLGVRNLEAPCLRRNAASVQSTVKAPTRNFAPFSSPTLPEMSDATAAPPTANLDARKGITLTAAKMYPPFKAELDGAITGIKQDGGALKLVGILGTGKDDAKTYAEVRCRDICSIPASSERSPRLLQ